MKPGDLILIVDDNELNAELLAYLLTALGYQTATARSAKDARAAIFAKRPDVILMDIRMPGMDGLELTRQLRADVTTREIPIVAVTASAMRGDDDKAIEAGCDGFITKPIDTQRFPHQLAELVAASRKR